MQISSSINSLISKTSTVAEAKHLLS
jgi:hypothetical protein